MDIEHVGVIGAGNMGHGIAEVAAIAGYAVTLVDDDPDALASGIEQIEWSLEKLADGLDDSVETIIHRIDSTTDVTDAVADVDLVIEAVPERMELKRDIAAQVDDTAPPEAIYASNTSSLSITEIAGATDRPDRVVGLHFFNPPVKMALVEVVHGEETSEATAETAATFVDSLDKTPIHVRKDVHRFVVNNVLAPYLDEPAWMVSNGEATVRQADAAMTHWRGYPMGPFELVDMTGIDVSYDVRQAGGDDVPPVMAEKVDAGHFGRKSGQGYYDYDGGPGVDYQPGDATGFDTLRVEARIVNAAAKLVEEDVATAEAVDTGARLGLGSPVGPCRRGDELGLDVVLRTLERHADEEAADRFEPAALLEERVAAGETGVTTGGGFFEY